jgi:hypothetical protein
VLGGEIALEEAMDLSSEDRLRSDGDDDDDDDDDGGSVMNSQVRRNQKSLCRDLLTHPFINSVHCKRIILLNFIYIYIYIYIYVCVCVCVCVCLCVCV